MKATSGVVTIRWLSRQPDLGLTVLGGRAGLDRELTWAHSIELADPSPWLRGGELVLTTGLRLPTDTGSQQRYVQALAEVGVAALGFGVGLSHTAVPETVVETASELDMPVLEVPLPTPFVAVVQRISERLAELRYQGVVEAAQAQPKMTRAALCGGIADIVKEVAGSLGAEVVFGSERDEPVAAYPPGASALLDTAAAELGLRGRGDGRADSATAEVEQTWLTAQTVRAGHRIHGHLVVRTTHALDTTDQLLLGHAVSLIALEQEKPHWVRREQTRTHGLLLGLALDGAVDSHQLREHLRRAGYPIDVAMSVFVLFGDNGEQVLPAADRVLAQYNLACVGTEHHGQVVLVAPAGNEELEDRLVAETADAVSTPVFVGRAGPAELDELTEAVGAATTAAYTARARNVTCVDARSLAGQLLRTEPAGRVLLERLERRWIEPLARAEQRLGTPLVATLRAFLEHHGQLEAASTSLEVHRHTLRSRIERVRQLTGADLDDAHVRAELLLALTRHDSTG